MKYEAIDPMTRGDIESAVRTDDPKVLSLAVLSAAIHSREAEWAESLCLRLARHRDANVRGNAILGLGHIARIHRTLNIEKAKPVIESALEDPSSYVRGQADCAADDVQHFLGWRMPRQKRKGTPANQAL